MTEKREKTYTFAWEGKDKNGRSAKGEIPSASIALAKAELRKQGINPSKVRKKAASFGTKKKIKPMDIAIFTRQLATMTKAGVPMIQAFDITAEGMDNATMKDLITNIKSDVAGGTSFAQSLHKHPKYFDDLYCNLVNSGEQSGALESLLDRIATYKEKTEALKAKIKKAMNYPIAVTAVAVIVTGILLVKVVPQFEEVFAGFGAELPAFTQIVINLSEAVQKWWLIIVVGIGIGLWSLKRILARSQKARNSFERLQLKIPIIGAILDKSAIARFARTLSTTFAAGVPLVDALDSVAGATGNVVYREAVEQVKEDISSGQQLQFAMRTTGIFPSMAIQMVAIGEESGALDEMLDKVATLYEEEVDNMVDGLTALMEPMIMVVLGTLVGGLIVAMYLPIFQLGSVV
ncbi:type II secretion system F family protein [Sansalvadorimonas sp. 2012CJ34-2]|uniref:Type II secretion system F family protein n=1 Tax=Parendozoicomonas callyspongiae TaxID=2942213 RepID=A0ABT0PK85_9GAMM|nr:type II secretion system F family protein [Sansalvadorimonas sp. 2012CJ34-2]MCL6271802.1 type II secretion system F family protein [Sansalvadorimonas sp. 2012CJ34-2]